MRNKTQDWLDWFRKNRGVKLCPPKNHQNDTFFIYISMRKVNFCESPTYFMIMNFVLFQLSSYCSIIWFDSWSKFQSHNAANALMYFTKGTHRHAKPFVKGFGNCWYLCTRQKLGHPAHGDPKNCKRLGVSERSTKARFGGRKIRILLNFRNTKFYQH